MWRIIGGLATFVTSAAVANRTVGCQVKLGGNVAQFTYNTTAVTAGLTIQAVYQPSTGTTSPAKLVNLQSVPFVPCWLEQGDSFGSLTGLMDVADQYSAISLVVEELWLTNQELSERERDAEVELEHLLTGGR